MHTKILTDKGDLSPCFAIDDRIFLGEGLFETLRVESSKPCFAEMHWQRLSKSAWELGIPFDLSLDDWQQSLTQQIKRDNLFHGGLKVILSGGSAPRGLVEHGQVSQMIIQTFNYTRSPNPIRIQSAAWLRDAANPLYQLKTINYLESITALRQAIAKGGDDILFFNMQKHALETSTANLFVIDNDKVFTPPLTDGVLSGTTRARVLSYCKELGIPCEERSINEAMLKSAQAMFTTNALQGIRLVLSFDDIEYKLDHALIQQLEQVIAKSE